MTSPRRSYLFMAVLACSLGAAPAMAADGVSSKHGEHETFAHDYAQTVLSIIQDTKKSYADRKDILRTAFAKSVDIDWIAKFVMGKQWSNATEEQRERYTTLYRKFLTETYVSSFAENPDKRIRDIKIYGINSEDDSSEEHDFTVRTEMQLADQENLKVNYLVREEDGHYKVRDFAIENVSLITTHRAEFGAISASSGVEGVIAHLEQVLAKPDTVLSMNVPQ